MAEERMNLVTFSSLYPSAARPTFGLFVETRLRELLSTERNLQSVVIAPVPWVPPGYRSARNAALASTPREERRGDVPVYYPRFLSFPGLDAGLKPMAMAAAALPLLRKLRASGYRIDLIDAHYFYPDGVAAAWLAQHLEIPFIVTARGSDLNYHAMQRVPRKLMVWAARRAAAIVTVSAALRDVAIRTGIAPEKIRVLRNGVDAAFFRPLERERIRERLGLQGTVLLSVGNLVPEKGHDLILEVLPSIPDATLLVVGDGPQRAALESLAAQNGVTARVRFLGAVSQAQLVEYYNAADVLVLASTREGWPNVLLESLACGTPAVAAAVGGCAEIITCPAAGALLHERNPQALATTLVQLRGRGWDRSAARRHAKQFSWSDTSRGLLALMRAAVGEERRSRTDKPFSSSSSDEDVLRSGRRH